MAKRLVIPAGESPDSFSFIVRNGSPAPWSVIAAENGVELFENLGSQWCVDNDIDGLGIAEEKPPAPPVFEPGPMPGGNLAAAADALDTLAQTAAASALADVRDMADALTAVAEALRA